MQIKVHDDSKIVEVWLTNAEKDDPALQERLKRMYAAYRQKKYMVCVFKSGGQDMYTSVRDLLAYNRRKIAENAVMREKQQRRPEMAR